MSAGSKRRIVSYLIVGLSLFYFTIMAGKQIAIPGLYYDEVLFVNAATGGLSNSFISKRIAGVPVMLMSYIGALKAYLYFPIFKLFGVSPATIRFPVIGISLLSILLVYFIARMTFSELQSALIVLMMAVDPVFIFMTKLDYGPIVLMVALKLLALFFFFKLVTTTSLRYLFLLLSTCLLGLYDKLNFIWFIVALGFASATLFREEFRKLYERHKLCFSILIFSFVGLLLCVSILMIFPQMARTQQAETDLLGRLTYIFSLNNRTMNGREFYNWVTDSELASGTATNYLTFTSLLLITISAFFAICRRNHRTRLYFFDRVVACYMILYLLIFVQIVVTDKAGGPHHIMMLYPFHHFLAVAVGVMLLRVMSGDSDGDQSAMVRMISKVLGQRRRDWGIVRGRKLGFCVAVILLGLLIGSDVKVGMSYTEAFAKGTLNPRWSPVIYDLATYVNRSEVDTIVFVDWGIHNQVFALSDTKTRTRCVELWLDFKRLQDPSLGVEIYKKFFEGKRVLAITHDAETEIMPPSRQRFLSFVDYFSAKVKLERIFPGVHQKPIFEVYYVDGRRESHSEPVNPWPTMFQGKLL